LADASNRRRPTFRQHRHQSSVTVADVDPPRHRRAWEAMRGRIGIRLCIGLEREAAADAEAEADRATRATRFASRLRLRPIGACAPT
jgi:hypothetical protein